MLMWANLVPRWAWKVLGLGAVVLVLLLLYRAQMAKAYQSGMTDCTRAHAQAAAEWERQNAKDVQKAEQQDSERRSVYEEQAAPIRERIIERVQIVPADCVDAGLRGLLNQQIDASDGKAASAPAKGG